MSVKAIYENGMFKPRESLYREEHTEHHDSYLRTDTP